MLLHAAPKPLPRPEPHRSVRPIRALLSLSLLGLGAGSATLRAEPVAYSGKVVDASGAGLPWALLRVDDGAVLGQSGADGAFSLTGEAAAALYYPDPKPPAFALPSPSRDAAVPPRFLLTGRRAADRHPAAAFLLAAVAGGKGGPSPARASRLGAGDSAGAPSDPDPSRRPPAPPVLGKSAAGHVLKAAMANHQAGAFPQTAAKAGNLVLVLAASPTDTAAYAMEKKLCLDTVNAYRAKLGLKALAWSKSLEAFADQGARYDSERNSAHGHFTAFSERAVPSDAENAIPGWPLRNYKTVAAVVAKGTEMMWAEGPGGGHYENIKGSHTQVGCGIFVTAAGNVWVVQDFK